MTDDGDGKVKGSQRYEGSDQPTSENYTVGGVRINALTIEQAADWILDPECHGDVHLCNAYTISLATKNHDLRSSLRSSSLNLADGAPVAWVGRALGLSHLRGPVAGPDLMARVLALGEPLGARHYLYGSTPSVLGQLQSAIARSWPRAQVVGAEAPPFGNISDSAIANSIANMKAADAQIVWVGLGTPLQDKIASTLAARYDRITYVAVGAAFDFIGGTKKRAPKWVRGTGLEWMFRLFSEPRRLWRRYLIGNTRFVALLVTDRPQRCRHDDNL